MALLHPSRRSRLAGAAVGLALLLLSGCAAPSEISSASDAPPDASSVPVPQVSSPDVSLPGDLSESSSDVSQGEEPYQPPEQLPESRPFSPSPYSNSKILPDMEVTLAQDTYPPETERFPFTVSNHGELPVDFFDEVEILQDGVWYSLEEISYNSTLPLWVLWPDESGEYECWTGRYGDALAPGHYRLVCVAKAFDPMEPSYTAEFDAIFYTEFDVA